MGVGVSGNESTDSIGILTNGREIGDRQLAINLFSNGQEMLCAGIINQYGQLIGDYSRLDDELWFSKPRDDGDDDDDALPRADQGIELNFKPSYQYTVCKDPVSKSIDNPVSDGGPCMNETSSSLKDSSVYQSQTSSPISVLRRRRSYSNVKKKATKRARSERGRFVKRNCLQGLQSIVPSFPATEQNLSIDPDRNSGSSPLDESTEPNPNPAKQLRTKKISDLLLSGTGDKQANAPEFYTGQALEESEPWEKDQDLIPTPIRKRKLQKMEVKKCMHCESTDTPQWRDGPMGRGTLCNACGVQYRNGRLFPDYRPLKSPTFNPSFHSKLKPTTKREQPKMAKKNCLRCESTETPQSEGSMGRGTLSNVCDVQQKNDMILPEYRPAKSSTFNPSLHSNPKPAPKKEPKMAVMKCMHCESTKTPQWRDGPMGRGTLCNACGVRFRSGKLFPEYRPINSPTFDPSLHSNLFKKVQQIRVDRNAKKSAVSGQSEQQA